MSRSNERADALLAERVLAELSVEAARRVARAVASEKVAAAKRQDELTSKLRSLAGGAARSQAAAQAVVEFEGEVSDSSLRGEKGM